jgi:hypothetical protein
LLREVVGLVPEEWIEPVPGADSDAVRAAYVDHLTARLEAR